MVRSVRGFALGLLAVAGACAATASAGPATAVAAAPVMLDAPEVWGAPMDGETIRARRGRWSTDSPLAWQYEWIHCDSDGDDCEPYAPASGGAQLELGPGLAGRRLKVAVTATNASGSTAAVSALTGAVAAPAQPESESLPQVSPVSAGVLPVPGVTLEVSAAPALWYPWLGPAVTRQWERCEPSGESCAPVAGATGAEYTLTSADVGKRVRAAVTSTNSTGSATATSAAGTRVQALAAPDLEDALSAPEPAIAAATEAWEGHELRADNGTWGHLSGALSHAGTTAGRSYEWLRCDAAGESCAAVPGANGPEHEMRQSDVGSRLRVRLTAANDAGQAVETSPPSSVVLAPEAPVVDATAFGDDAYVGHFLRAGYAVNLGAGDYDASYQWRLCDAGGSSCTAISGATNLTYAPAAGDEGHTLRVEVTVENRIGSSSDVSPASAVVEQPPTPEAVDPPTVTPSPWGTPTLSPNPVAGKPLVANDDGVWSDDLATGTREWQWQRCEEDGTGCRDIPGAWSRISSEYTPRWRDVGYRLRVRIARFAAHGEAWVSSTVTGVVGPGAPRVVERPAIEGPPRVREYLWAIGGEWAPATPELEFQWLRCDAGGADCVPIEDAIWSEHMPEAGDEGSALRVRVTATNDEGETQAESPPTPPIGPPHAPENVEPPTIDGDAEIGATLWAGDGLWHGADPLEMGYRWLRCDGAGEACVAIPDATDWYYEVTPAEAGSTIRLEVTAENDVGSASARSAPTAQLDPPIAPENVVPPEVSGTLAVGETLQSHAGEWDNYPTEFAYQWQRCDAAGEACVDITGAEAPEYLLAGADQGARVRLEVTAANGGGSDVATSDPTSAIGAMQPPANTVRPRVATRPEETIEVLATEGTWSGGKPMSFEYQWQRCNNSGASCVDIAGAHEKGYTPVAADVGNRLKVRVQATNAAGSDDETSNAAQTTMLSPPRFDEPVAIDGEPREGAVLDALTTGLRGSATIALTYSWLRCDTECEPISGADGDVYVSQAADVGSRLRLRVHAQNGAGETVSKSAISPPVEPADSAGAPVAVERPRLSGLQRVTETAESTSGRWRGADPIATTVRWQRCATTEASCTDIPGAIGLAYEIAAADEGQRLRTVVEAENTIDEATATSALSPPIRPELNTAFKLQGTATLEDVADAITLAGATWLTVDYVGEWGAESYSAGTGASVSEVLAALSGPGNPDGADAPVTRFKVVGDVETAELGALASQIAGRLEVPSIRATDDSSPAARLLSLGTPVVVDPFLSTARLEGWGHDCVGDDCEDVDDESDWYAQVSPPWLDHTRVLETQFHWAADTADMLQRMYVEDRLFAWEHDVKLHNGDNIGVPGGLGCLPWETNNFWIGDRDDGHIATNIPAAAGLYWDTDASDGCEVKDLTYGVYHPELLQEGEWYFVTIYFKSAGDEESSTVSWESQLLERAPSDGNGGECDWDPWCVNVWPYNRVREGETLIPSGLDLRLPHCWEYNDATDYAVDECVWNT